MNQETFEVISVIGQSKKGKSYTLNILIQKMSGIYITPFQSSDYNEPYTQGIWMYLLPKCSSDSIYMQSNIDGMDETFPCSEDNKAYIILDI